MNTAKFAKRMDFNAKAFASNASSLLDKTVLTVHSVLVLATPVKSGRAKGNWQIGFGKAPEGTIDDVSQYGNGPALARAKAAMAGGDKGTSFWRPQREVHVTNNLPYITRLNQGWSTQAPSGFVEEAVAAGVKVVRGAKLLDKSGLNVGVGE